MKSVFSRPSTHSIKVFRQLNTIQPAPKSSPAASAPSPATKPPQTVSTSTHVVTPPPAKSSNASSSSQPKGTSGGDQGKGSGGGGQKKSSGGWGPVILGTVAVASVPILVGFRASSDEDTKAFLKKQLPEPLYGTYASIFGFDSAAKSNTPSSARKIEPTFKSKSPPPPPPVPAPGPNIVAAPASDEKNDFSLTKDEPLSIPDALPTENSTENVPAVEPEEKISSDEAPIVLSEEIPSGTKVNDIVAEPEPVDEVPPSVSEPHSAAVPEIVEVFIESAPAIESVPTVKVEEIVVTETQNIAAESVAAVSVETEPIAPSHPVGEVGSQMTEVEENVGEKRDTETPKHPDEKHDRVFIEHPPVEFRRNLTGEEHGAREDGEASGESRRVGELLAVIDNWSRAEGVRLAEALNRQQEMDDSKHAEIMAKYQAETEEKTRAQIEALLQERDEEEARRREDLIGAVVAKTNEVVANFRRSAAEQLKLEIVERERELGAQARAQAAAEGQRLSVEYQKDTAVRITELQSLRVKLIALDALLTDRSSERRDSHRVHQLSMATLALVQALDTKQPFASQMRYLKDVSKGDQLVEAAIEVIPDALAVHGVQTYHHLVSRFKEVSREGKRVALVPADGGILPEIIGTLLSKIPKMDERDFPSGSGVDVTFERARWYLKRGHLYSATAELEKLEGRPRAVAQDWINEAKERLIIDQTVLLIRAHIGTLVAALC